MRRRRAEGATMEQIHAEIGAPRGICHSQTEKIVYGLAWKHVT